MSQHTKLAKLSIVTDRSQPSVIARLILNGFNRHYRLFRAVSASAQDRFERGAWNEVIAAHRDRIFMYDRRVKETVRALHRRVPKAADDRLWPEVKLAFIGLLYGHAQPECAETFFNSVACRVLSRRYYHNRFIFFRPATSTEHLDDRGLTYQSFYLSKATPLAVARRALARFGWSRRFVDLGRDLERIIAAFRERYPDFRVGANFQIRILSSLFFRNRAAFIVGRVINDNREHPFVVPILRRDDGRFFVDTVILDPAHVAGTFSLARAYFMVDMEVPAAHVDFLQALMPRKPRAELYTLLGLQKQGKTLFYRELQAHLRHSSDKFVVAPGIRGMVMLVFTLPSFPYVFKIIRDSFDAPKEATREEVQAKYLWVKMNDRVGRLADTLEYSDVAFPLARFDRSLLAEMRRLARSSFYVEGDSLVVKHMYLERRLTPLDMFLATASSSAKREAVSQLGNCLRDLAAANIFPGDMLPKNFGVTRYGRVVCYDYDEMGPLTDFNFRNFPAPRDDADELAAEPWYGVGPADIFPAELATFMFTDQESRQMYHEENADLSAPEFWEAQQARARAGQIGEFFSYPRKLRFKQ